MLYSVFSFTPSLIDTGTYINIIMSFFFPLTSNISSCKFWCHIFGAFLCGLRYGRKWYTYSSYVYLLHGGSLECLFVPCPVSSYFFAFDTIMVLNAHYFSQVRFLTKIYHPNIDKVHFTFPKFSFLLL